MVIKIIIKIIIVVAVVVAVVFVMVIRIIINVNNRIIASTTPSPSAPPRNSHHVAILKS